MSLGNISKKFTINNITKTRIKRHCKFFSVDFNRVDTNNILDIHRALVKGEQYKIMFE